jgi:hypothetical protein
MGTIKGRYMMYSNAFDCITFTQERRGLGVGEPWSDAGGDSTPTCEGTHGGGGGRGGSSGGGEVSGGGCGASGAPWVRFAIKSKLKRDSFLFASHSQTPMKYLSL